MTNPMPSSPRLVGSRPGIPSKPTEVYRPLTITCSSYIVKIEPPEGK